MPDFRPLFSIPPEQAQRLGQDLADALKLQLDETFNAIASLPGNPAERENDALSLVAALAAMIGVQFVGQLIDRKHIDIDLALTFAVADIAYRMNDTVASRPAAPDGLPLPHHQRHRRVRRSPRQPRRHDGWAQAGVEDRAGAKPTRPPQKPSATPDVAGDPRPPRHCPTSTGDPA